ncbi:MAG: hypothetical protein WCE21_05760 [Candidatus Babeliales bacterium]
MKQVFILCTCMSLPIYAMEQGYDERRLDVSQNTPHNSPSKSPTLSRKNPSARSITALNQPTTGQLVPTYQVPPVATVSADAQIQKKINTLLNAIESSNFKKVTQLLTELKQEAAVDEKALAVRIKPLAQAVHQKVAYLKDVPNNTNKKLMCMGLGMIGFGCYQLGINIYDSVTKTTETTQEGLTAGNYPSAIMWLTGGSYYLYNGLTNQTPDVTLTNAMSIYQLLQKEYPTL